MARIRTIKPEAFVSESMAAVSLTARWTFLGLLTQADDYGRHRDHAAIIAGRLWPLDPDHTPFRVEEDLQQLTGEGMICRYTGCDGRGYLHVVNWAKHQKIDRPSASRLPRCPVHQAEQRCGECKDVCVRHPQSGPGAPHPSGVHDAGTVVSPRRFVPEGSPGLRGGLVEPSAHTPDTGTASTTGHPHAVSEDKGTVAMAENSTGAGDGASRSQGENGAGCGGFDEGSSNPRGWLDESSASGSRILDPGSVPTGRTAPALDTVSARILVGEYVASCARRPPERFLGHLGREINGLLDEGIDPGCLRTALERLRTKGLHPSTLASLVNEVMNAAPAGAGAKGVYQPWTNPADSTAYEEAL
ncbi:hypothetical protein OK074_5072 [Actinobacteria bacterium OK074]|nr:hypothetical protein OK074_5072 [Actinobacteria bacterium OK074]